MRRESQALTYWRRLNAALVSAGLPTATLGEAWAAYLATRAAV